MDRLSHNSTYYWFIGGDFNSLLALNERVGGDQVSYIEIEEFISCVDDYQLQELKYIGFNFTCSNQQRNTKVFSRLDRFLANKATLDAYPKVFINPLLLLLHHTMTKRKKPFYFFNMWTQALGFKEAEVKGSSMYQVVTTLKRLNKPLRQLNKEAYGHVHHEVVKTQQELHQVQHDIHAQPMDGEAATATI
ncbi:hypothetical protein Cgig2_000760 [Carnegiea gigantea]|uniref:Uncharacterized protein n=1 Tax=Carnegiea gigantea TaxID=171969 RepID=A0A9Q1JQY5_9CARY|nr:hypothetical protein Cgig2_000760 [Carnegiea gigantea]